MDKARKQTDKMLNDLERRVNKVYANDPALKRIEKKYKQYMDMVSEATRGAYLAFNNESDIEHRKELKKAYMDDVKALTVQSKEYKKLIQEFTDVLTQVNQKALSLVNTQMDRIYALNYNQVADDCRKAGIRVNGKK